MVTREARWVGGHYGDEFAEAHGKEMVVRSRLGLPLPSAGVGCALTRSALARLAFERGGEPFRRDSLTEDYEVGMVIGACGLAAVFVDTTGPAGDRIVSRGSFPESVDAAVKQKARWVAGIALAGWDHIGWWRSRRGAVDCRRGRRWLMRWMLWRDRRAPLAALILLAGYAGLFATAAVWAGQGLLGWPAMQFSAAMRLLIIFNALMLCWRIVLRVHFTARCYGWREAAFAAPRALVANLIAMLAVRRAIILYWRMLRSGTVVWDKTEHVDNGMGSDAVDARVAVR
jgi:adsorption protein B